ncbi:MAG: NAD(P)/FAD-dependent oxidoreductase [Candidatus Omnitrophica bacterium]|nr:NAD(P)/FAD-dependent oxidoreductase [Candidatus Omnitrophota bacterium]
MSRIIIVGAGPAGMMAAIRASQFTPEVVLIEKNSLPGNKLLLSGKGRCNITNNCELEDFLKRFSANGQFLRDAFKKFFNRELIEFFRERGLVLKIERQNRVFPETDRSASIVEVLKKQLVKSRVMTAYNVTVNGLQVKAGKISGVRLESGEVVHVDKVVLATGGVTYSFTGSTGDGLFWAQNSGHKITPIRPGLVALEIRKENFKLPEGLTLKNIRLRFSSGKKEIISEIGEMVFTDFGISGPLVLTLSGQIADWILDKLKIRVEIDFKPALSREQLENRLLREFNDLARKNLDNVLKELLPLSLVKIFLGRLKIPADKKANQVTQQERKAIVDLLKGFNLEIKCTRPLEDAMITRGGVSLKDIDPRTMESRRVKGLYFCGEMIDVDADTGGFNLQAAFSTGYLAGESAALSK